ncbi:restriction endonuclease subunit S [Sediminitomix flava]|uniref:Type I restriction enzyme S subunit n=1 Tax=Sediminitomix flava TaxID=379075 RepID=A0A315ZAD5_SEDFL|nr:restriction endonuclease subunit S [Sediminitomix flava]PWJ42242.1 type I restriction enzyme S subunit [Sediminitomix flava]
MNKGWREVKLIDVTSKIGSGSTPRGGKEAYKTEGISLIRSQNVLDFEFSTDGLAFIDEDQAEKLKNVIIEEGDILINITGDSVARVCSAPKEYLPARVNQHVAILRPNKEELDSSFLKYFLLSPYQKAHLLTLASSGATRNALTKSMLENLEVKLPPLHEQKAIAHILGTLDDKIELNRQMNKSLEEMAQALFQSWFVDFDPVIDNALKQRNEIPKALAYKAEKRKAVLANSEYPSLPEEIQALFPSSFVYNETLAKWIPEGWEVKKLEENVEVKYGKDHKKLSEGQFPVYGSGGIMRYVDQTLCEAESVLIPRKGTLNNIMYVREPFWSVDTMFFTKFKIENYVKFLFYTLRRLNFTEMNVGSAVPSMTTKVLNSMNLLTPSNEILIQFEKELEQFYLKIESNSKETENLTQLRDILLPQLISGKLSVPEVMLEINNISEI